MPSEGPSDGRRRPLRAHGRRAYRRPLRRLRRRMGRGRDRPLAMETARRPAHPALEAARMSDLERAPDEFRAAMLAKFHLPRVVARWGPTSVTLDGNLDRMVDADVWSHYQEEFVERMKARTEADRAAEDIDVANLAFLSWYANSR